MNRRKFIKTIAIGAAILPLLAKAFSKLPHTAVETEWDRCANDPVYFINNYVKLKQHDGTTPLFKLFPEQEVVIRKFQKSNRHAITKDRLVGMTSLTLAYALWLMVFKPKQTILIGTYSNAGSQHQMNVFRFAYHNLPNWMKVPLITDNRQSMAMSNGSKITMGSTRNPRGCGDYYTMVAVDEGACCENMHEFMQVVYPSITSTGTKTIMYSSDSPNGSVLWSAYANNLGCKWHSL